MHLSEEPSAYEHLDNMSTLEILTSINNEDKTIANSIEEQLPRIEKLVEVITSHLQNNGRLIYIGSGTSGRLGILDASECPPTFGVKKDVVTGLIAGGDRAIKQAIEQVEDNEEDGVFDIKNLALNTNDIVIGISASGKTPYVLGAMKYCRAMKITTGCIACNFGPLADEVHYPIVIRTGAEFITGSTRMKAGTATKMVLNMISTATMIKLGHIKNNFMIDMQLTNNKLIERGTRIIMQELNINYDKAKEQLLKEGSIRKVLNKK